MVLDDFGSFLYSSSVATRTGARPSIRWCSCVRREQIALAGLRDLEAAAEPGRVGRAQEKGVELLRASFVAVPTRPAMRRP